MGVRSHHEERQCISVNEVVEILIGLVPLLDRIKTSIEESTGTIPKASTQLSSVTQATEMATVEILNTLDRMTERIGSAEGGLVSMKTELGAAAAPVEGKLLEIGKTLAETRQDAMAIAMALQVQDITSQQIAGVTHMIESVRHQLLGVLGQMDKGLEHPPSSAPDGSSGHFDSNAQFTRSTDRQDDADAIIQQWQKVNHE